MDYSQMDCLVVCVLSHGESGIIYARDAAYQHETLWGPFTADNCKTLAGKPKLFFLQVNLKKNIYKFILIIHILNLSHTNC